MLSIPLTSEGLEMDSTLELYNLEGEKGMKLAHKMGCPQGSGEATQSEN